MRIFKILFLMASMTLIAAVPTLADTEVESMDPAQGETVDLPPEQVRLKLAGTVDAAFSPLEVYDSQGRRVDEDNAGLAPEDPTTLMVDLREDLPAGSYTVEYRFTGDDGHTVTGAYEFAVAETREPAETTTEETTVEETTSVSNDGEEQSSVEDETTQAPVESSASQGGGLANMALYVGLGIVGLAVVGMLVARRR